MEKSELQKLTTEELQKKAKTNKILIGLFIPCILAFCYVIYSDYSQGKAMDMPNLIIAICSVGGLASVIPTLKAINQELKERSN
jgi:hypothetical protein